jgi:pimeloyl-ACP methyl ester carboxylesterase
MKSTSWIGPLLVVGIAATGPSVARGQELAARAEMLGVQAAEALTGEDAVPFVSPAREREAAKKAHPGATFEELRVPSGDVELRAWVVSLTRGLEPRGVVLVLPGWQSNAGFALGQTDFLLAEGYRLVIVEDRAHAFIDEPESYRGFLREDVLDVERTLDFIAARSGLAELPLILYGFSWGGTKAILTAAERKDVAAVVVDGAVSDPAHLAHGTFMEYMPPTHRRDPALHARFLEAFQQAAEARLGYRPDAVDVRAAAAEIAPRPFLFLHGEDDEVVPLASARALFESAKDPKRWVTGSRFGHCLGMRRQPELYVPAVLGFLDDVTRRGRPVTGS